MNIGKLINFMRKYMHEDLKNMYAYTNITCKQKDIYKLALI